jgi:hypothetical protein
MLEIAITIGSLLIGGAISWAISHLYYRRSSAKKPAWYDDAPDWAKEFMESLPNDPPSIDRLVELYQDALERGDISVDPSTGYVKCPKCGASPDHFKSWEAGDASRDMMFRGVKCGKCGHELTWEEV